MEELVSEKHFRLIRQRDALKKEIAMNNKRIEFYTLKIQDLKDEKEDIDFKIKWCKMGNLAYFLDEMPQTLSELGVDVINEMFYRKRIEKLKNRKKEILKELANLCMKKEKKKKINALLKLELVNVREEIKNL